jgi:phage-related holin
VAGGIVHFNTPQFRIRYRNNNCKDSVNTPIGAHFYDIVTYERDAAIAQPTSLPISWMSNRFATFPVSLKAIKDSVLNRPDSISYTVVQDASISLSVDTVSMEHGAVNFQVLYGLFDHEFSSWLTTSAIIDSLNGLLSAGRIKNITLPDTMDTTNRQVNLPVILPVTSFLQTFVDAKNIPDQAYLYLFAKPNTSQKWGRVYWKNPSSVSFSALFSNPKK